MRWVGHGRVDSCLSSPYSKLSWSRWRSQNNRPHRSEGTMVGSCLSFAKVFSAFRRNLAFEACIKCCTENLIFVRIGPTWLLLLEFLFFAVALRPNACHGHLILEFLDHTQRRITVGMTPLDEWSASRTDLHLTTHNTHNKHPCPRWDSNPRSQQASGRRPTP